MFGLAVLLAAAPAPIALSRTVPAKPDAVWQAWTTAAGTKTFFAPDAKVEAKPGGAFEQYFVPTLPPGQRGSEGCTVVSADAAKKVLVFTWNFPPSLPRLREARALTQVTIALTPEGGGTKVALTHTGFPDGEEGAKGRAYFEKAWGHVLARLDRSFKRGPIDWKYTWVPSVPADKLALMTGAWKVTDGKTTRHETWVATPIGLTGMYSEIGGDAPFYEFSAVAAEGEEWVLTMRMFSGAGLESFGPTKTAPLRFVLESVDEKNAVFFGDGANKARLTYRLADKSSLEITLERPGSKPEVFVFTRT